MVPFNGPVSEIRLHETPVRQKAVVNSSPAKRVKYFKVLNGKSTDRFTFAGPGGWSLRVKVLNLVSSTVSSARDEAALCNLA